MPEIETSPTPGEPATPAGTSDAIRPDTLSKEGEYWTITYRGEVFRLRDTKGLHSLARLLSHPWERHSAASLLGADGKSPEQARVMVTKRLRADPGRLNQWMTHEETP